MPVIPRKSKLYFVRDICSFSNHKYKKVNVHDVLMPKFGYYSIG